MGWKIDPSHTQIEFSVKHLMITTVRGRFGEFEGAIEIDEENPENSAVSGTIDVASLSTNDDQRDTHLRSPDFFDVEEYPRMAFRSTRVERQGGNRYKVYGDLTIKEVTNEIVFDVVDEGRAKDPWGGERRALSATSKLNRKDFGLNWNVALEAGGWLVGDEVKIAADVQLVQE